MVAVLPADDSPLNAAAPGQTSVRGGVIDYPVRENTVLDMIAKGIPATAVGIVDTFSSSLGITEYDELAQTATDMMGTNDYYNLHKEGIRLTGDIVGLFGPATLATKGIQGAGKIAQMLGAAEKGSLASKVFTSTRVGAIERQLRMKDLSLANQATLGQDLIENAGRAQIASRLKYTKGLDGVKEGLAQEFAIFATMNESQTLYPEDFELTDHLGFAALGVGINAVPGYLVGRATAARSANSAAVFASKAANPADVGLEERINRPGSRDAAIGTYFRMSEATSLEEEAARANGLQLAEKNFNNLTLSSRNGAKSLIEAAMKDGAPVLDIHTNPIVGSVVDTLMSAGKADNNAVAGMITAMPVSKYEEVAAKQTSSIAKLEKSLKSKNETLALLREANPNDVEAAELFAKEIDEMQVKLDDVRGMQVHVVNEFGERIPAKEYLTAQGKSPRQWDEKITDWKRRDTMVGGKTFATNEFLAPDGSFSGTMRLTLDQNANLYVNAPGLMKTVPQRANRTDVLWDAKQGAPAFENVKSQFYRGVAGQILHDYAQTYHITDGQLGAEVYGNLTVKAKEALVDWTGSSNSGLLRKVADNKDVTADQRAIFDEIYEAFEPFRAKLHELADAHDGTILLFRGEKEGKNVTKAFSDLQSFTTSLDVARKFAGADGAIIQRRVPIADIVAPVGGLGDEFEYMVVGNFSRKFGETLTEAGAPAINSLWKDLPTAAHSVVFDGIRKFAEGYQPKGSAQLILAPESHWTKFLTAQEVLRKNPEALGDIAFTNNFKPKSLAEAQEYMTWAIRRGQFNEWNAVQDTIEKAAKSPIKREKVAGLNNGLTPERIRQMFLFPAPRKSLSVQGKEMGDPLFHEGVSELEQVFYELRMQGDRDLSVAVPGGLKDLQIRVNGKAQIVDSTSLMQASTLQAPLNADLSKLPTKPSALVISRNIGREQLTRADQVTSAASRFTDVLDVMTTSSQHGSVLVSQIADLMALPEYKAAKNVHLISEGSRRGMGIITTQAFNFRDNPTMKALSMLQSEAQKRSDKFAEILYGAPNRAASERVGRQVSHTEVFQRARSDKATQVEFGTYATARRYGWRLAPEAVKGEDGLYRFVLSNAEADFEANQKIMQTQFGRDFDKNTQTFMPYSAVEGTKEVALRDGAYEVALALRDAGQQLLLEQNIVMRGLGQHEIRSKEWWMPPKNFAGREVSYIMDESGKVLRTVTGRTPQEVQRRLESDAVKELRDSFQKQGRTLSIRSQAEVDTWYDLQTKTFFDLQDASDPLTAMGAKSKGSSVGLGVEDGGQSLNDSVDAILKQIQNVSKRSLSLIMEPQLNYTKQMHKSYAFENDVLKQSIWQSYVDTLLGNGAIQRKGYIGETYRMAESVYDEGMLKLWEKTQGKGVRGMLMDKISSPDKQYQAVKNALGDFMPYDKARLFAEEQLGVSTPGRMKEHFGKLNYITSTIILRMFEVTHPILNMAGVITNMPAITRALAKQAEETPEQWSTRIRLFGTEFGTNPEDKIAALNPAKLLTNAAAYGFTKSGKADWEYAAANGYLKQEVSEIQRIISAPHETMVSALVKKGIEKVSWLSDHSEEWARGWAHMGGLLVADSLGIEQRSSRHTFAHQFANDVIGDYRASNRPVMFQGAAGMPLGLFQTYMWNYYQRMFGYIENGQKRAAAVQVALQSGLYGVSSVPGWDQFAGMVSGAHDDKMLPSDVLRQAYGRDAGDLLLNGTLSSIPKLFGADGIAFYTRGDANLVRVPNYLNVAELPQVGLLNNAMQLVSGVVDEFRAGGQYSNQRTLELLGTWLPNRPLARIAEIAAGTAVDRRGNLISSDTREGLSVAARMMGLRPMVENHLITANYENKQTEAAQREIRTRLRDTLEPQIRSGVFDENSMSKAFEDYLRSGGNPRQFQKYLRNMALAANTPQSEQDLIKYLKSDAATQSMRLMDAMGPGKIDE